MTNPFVRPLIVFIVISLFLSGWDSANKKETEYKSLPDKFFTINTKFITRHPEYLQADFEIKRGLTAGDDQYFPERHFLFHFNKEGNYYDIRFNEFYKDSTYEVKVRRFPDNSYKSFYIRRHYRGFDMNDTTTPPNIIASNLSLSGIKAVMPDFNGKAVNGHVSGITINLDEMLSDSYGIPFLFYKDDNSYQDTLRFLLDCIKAKGYWPTYTKFLVQFGSGAISYDQFLSQKEKWMYSQGDISNCEYLSKDGKVLDSYALKKDAVKTAKDFLNEEKTHFLNRSNRINITGSRH